MPWCGILVAVLFPIPAMGVGETFFVIETPGAVGAFGSAKDGVLVIVDGNKISMYRRDKSMDQIGYLGYIAKGNKRLLWPARFQGRFHSRQGQETKWKPSRGIVKLNVPGNRPRARKVIRCPDLHEMFGPRTRGRRG